MQFIFHFLANCKHNAVVVLAQRPAELVLDEIELEPIALGNDRLNVANAALPDRILGRGGILGDEPHALVGVGDKLCKMLPAVT